MKKTCSICCKTKNICDFWKNKKSKDGRQKHCNDCHRIMAHNWYLRHIEYCRKKGRITIARWRKKHPQEVKMLRKRYWRLHGERYKENKRKKVLEEKKELVNKYGNRCECCGINDYRFLTFDHINNDGQRHRRKNLYRIIKKENYPNYLRLLCFNCNYSRQIYGGKEKICPHKLLK